MDGAERHASTEFLRLFPSHLKHATRGSNILVFASKLHSPKHYGTEPSLVSVLKVKSLWTVCSQASSGRAIGVALPRVQFCLATIFLLTLCFLSGRNEATSAAGVAHALSADYSDVTTVVHKENPVDSQETLEPPKARVTDLNDSAEASEGKVQNLNETPSSSPMEGAPRDVTTVVDSVTNQKKIIGATEANPVDDHNTGSPSANAAQEVSKLASSTSWIFGMILGAAASFAGALGDNIVRLSYVKVHFPFGDLI